MKELGAIILAGMLGMGIMLVLGACGKSPTAANPDAEPTYSVPTATPINTATPIYTATAIPTNEFTPTPTGEATTESTPTPTVTPTVVCFVRVEFEIFSNSEYPQQFEGHIMVGDNTEAIFMEGTEIENFVRHYQYAPGHGPVHVEFSAQCTFLWADGDAEGVAISISTGHLCSDNPVYFPSDDDYVEQGLPWGGWLSLDTSIVTDYNF